MLFTVMAVMACSGGVPPTQTVTPVRVVAPQPVRDASGTILTTPVTIPEATEFSAQTLDFLSSQTAAEGDPVRLEVEKSVLVNGAIAIAAGSPVKGIISSVTHASHLGKAGSISIRVESGEAVDGQTVRLRATKSQGEGDKVGSVVALSVLGLVLLVALRVLLPDEIPLVDARLPLARLDKAQTYLIAWEEGEPVGHALGWQDPLVLANRSAMIATSMSRLPATV